MTTPAQTGPAGTEAAIRAALDRLCPPGPLGLALSGGGDSTALLAVAADWAAPRRLRAATVDHGLRPDSAAEALAVAGACAHRDIPHSILTWHDAPGRGNLSAAARAARQRLLGDWARAEGLSAVLLGHTLDDQAETVLLRLARGSGLDGLCGMAPASALCGTLWLRPLLGLRRTALRALLTARGIDWAEDPSNEDPRFDRVRARRALAILAPLGITAEGVAATAARLASQRLVLDRARQALADTARRWGPLGEAVLTLPPMRAAEADTALHLLSDTLRRIGGAEHGPRHAALAALWAACLAPGFKGRTLAGSIVLRRGGALILCREPACAAPPVPLAAETLWDGRWCVSAAGWPDGAVLGALGLAGLDALAAAARTGAWRPPAEWQDAPRPARAAAPALWLGTQLLSVPLAGYRDPVAGDAQVKVALAPDPRARYGRKDGP